MKKFDERPYVVCHMVSSIDGRISGGFFRTEEMRSVMPAGREIRAQYDCDAVINGAVTAAEIYADGFVDELPRSGRLFDRKDFIAPTELKNYVVCVDTDGELNWTKNYVDRPGMPKSHVIEVLCESVSDDYLAYLQSLGISYIFAGERKLDLAGCMEKLKTLFHIDSVLTTGGGAMNWSLLQAGCLDEVSIVIVPVVEGSRDAATLFDKSEYMPGGEPVGLKLSEAKALDGGGVWLKYLR